MKSKKKWGIMQILLLSLMVTVFTNSLSFAEIEIDVKAIEAEITAGIAAGDNPELAAKNAIASAVWGLLEAHPNFTGGVQALNTAILEAMSRVQITGLDDTDLLLAVNHALGNNIDPSLEGYRKSNNNNPGYQGRNNARLHGGHAYGPGGKPGPASGI
ncbi:hypothetical protein ACFL0S_02195 [Thermodesulfobacteriota bacterium]